MIDLYRIQLLLSEKEYITKLLKEELEPICQDCHWQSECWPYNFSKFELITEEFREAQGYPQNCRNYRYNVMKGRPFTIRT